MDVCADNFSNAPCEEVPNDNATVIAAHCQQGTPTVEGAGEGHADTVQSAICLLTTQNTQLIFSPKVPTKASIWLQYKSVAGDLPLDSFARTILGEE